MPSQVAESTAKQGAKPVIASLTQVGVKAARLASLEQQVGALQQSAQRIKQPIGLVGPSDGNAALCDAAYHIAWRAPVWSWYAVGAVV